MVVPLVLWMLSKKTSFRNLSVLFAVVDGLLKNFLSTAVTNNANASHAKAQKPYVVVFIQNS
jgi:hypothetical protein